MKKLFNVILSTMLILGTLGFTAPSVEASDIAHQQASALLDQMTPEEKVGQLFLITFKGQDTSQLSQIFDLIANHHIGGIVLLAANDNFTGPENTVESANELINSLQQIEWDTSINGQISDWEGIPSQYVPLFVGISQEGDSSPTDQILNGVTEMPSLMSIGATWDSDLAQQAGEVLGKELSAIGFNLLLGPSLDVLEVLPTLTGEDLGVRTFGGDPYWVGKMGQAYIQGIHEGSQNQIAVISKHFPGSGGSDREPEEEVATVQKSLEQLKQIELAPFFAVTGNAVDQEATTDGLLVSHIRYQGFQGNIRATTRPVSFDQGALDLLMALNPFSEWRQDGGLIVSDDLGSPALRKFYDPTGRNFDARQVAKNAFLAGNDLLYMDNFLSTGDENTYITIVRTLESFIQKYNEDTAFALRVDRSVERILAKKFEMYPTFNINTTRTTSSGLSEVGNSQNLVFEIAQDAVTLISPGETDLSSVLPGSPEQNERIIFITDTLTQRQCSTCLEQNIVSVDILQNAILKLYGPQAGGLVISSRLSSYSFTDLENYLNEKEDTEQFADDLMLADWVVISFLKLQSDQPSSTTLKRLLTEQTSLLRDKKVVAFSFNAPYYLDATDISKLTAYYGFYSKAPQFFDVAARILFEESIPNGALPVSVPGIGYDLISATSPNSDQIIHLYLSKVAQASTTQVPSATQTPTGVSEEETIYRVGDVLSIRTSEILDTNNHQVPDGTVVRFIMASQSSLEGTISTQIDTTTVDGVAQIDFRIQNPGQLEIKVTSEPAMQSDVLSVDVVGESVSAAITLVVTLPTSAPTETPVPTYTFTPTSTMTVTPEPTASPTLTPTPLANTNPGDWLLSMGVVWTCAAGFFWFMPRKMGVRWRVRRGLVLVIGGLLVYCYFAFELPGSIQLLTDVGNWVVLPFTLGGILLGWAAGQLWQYLVNQ